MDWRLAILLGMFVLLGCNGPARVPPPGVGQPPNTYYQPPATPYIPPTYGAPTSTPPGTIPPTGFGQANPAPNNAVSFAPTGATTANWQPVTKPAAIGNSTPNSNSTVNPQTILTTVKTPNPFVNTNNPNLPEITSNTQTATVPPTAYPPPPYHYGAPPATPAYPPVNYGGASTADPWRGR